MANITNNTIFDDVFRTMVEKMPNLAVPLINEIFGTTYPEDIEIIQRRNEHQTKQGEIITDSQLLIAEKIYHLECQSTQDSEMVVRMIEYDFSIGLETMEKEKGKYRMYLPHSCILYLRGNKKTEKLTIEVVAPEGETWEYKVPAVYAGHYTKEEILEKRLFFLLPFYIMRYEKADLETGKEYRDLIELIIRIADYQASETGDDHRRNRKEITASRRGGTAYLGGNRRVCQVKCVNFFDFFIGGWV